LPPIETQKKIVSILEKAEKIKEKRKQVKILSEEYLRSIFSKVLSNKNGNVNKSFMELFDVKTGKLNSNASELGGKYPFFTCSKETFTINSYAYDEEALLLSGNNAAGEYSVKHYSGKFNAYQRTYILNLKEQGSYEFFRYQFENKLEFLRENSKGTNTKYLTLGILKNLNFILPPIETQLNFTTIAKKLEHTSRKQQLATEQASLLFDSLMKEAFKGGLVE
jgi:type I restriction enzyme S subunit